MKIVKISRCSYTGLDKIYHGNHSLYSFGIKLFSWQVNRKSKASDWY